MSGLTNSTGAVSGVIGTTVGTPSHTDQVAQTVTLYFSPSAAKSGGSTDHYVVWNNIRSGSTGSYGDWMTYSGADVTLQPGVYDLHYQMTLLILSHS